MSSTAPAAPTAPTPAEARSELARRELRRRGARSSLEAFCGQMDDGYRQTPTTKIICRHLDALANGDIRTLAIFMPPGAGKTYHAGERFPAYMLGRRPSSAIMSVSYAERKAQDSSWKVRELIRDRERWPWPDIDVPVESSALGKWRTTKGGEFQVAGIGAGIGGFHPHGLIIDDPIGDPDDALSASFRDRQWRWYTEMAARRLPTWGWQLLMMTRWHESDLAARILEAYTNWTVLSLPLYAEPDDQLGRAPGEVLPGYDGSQIPDLEAGQMSSRAFAAQYQQRPTPETGNLFSRAWFEHRGDPPSVWKPGWLIQVLDAAWKTGVANDYSVIATWGFDGVYYYVVDVWRDKVEFPDLRRIAAEAYEWYRPSAMLVEDAAAGTAIIQEFRRGSNIPVLAVPALGSKESRAEAITPIFESGRVVLPRSAPWLDAWIEEHVSFPHGKNDDQVDTTTMALARLSQTITRPFAVRQ